MHILGLILIIATIIQALYFIFFHVNVAALKNKTTDKNLQQPAVSIIICTKNEAKNVELNFQSWANQLSVHDELIIIDDFSTDDTFKIAHTKAQPHHNIKILKADQDALGKKQALTEAIHSSSHNYVLVTDADCSPHTEWKHKMIEKLQPHISFVLGYAPFLKHPTLLNLFQRFECMLTAIQYFSFANAGLPYMGVGRNMLYKKEAFINTSFTHPIASGDDDLLVSATANKNNTAVCLDPQSFVYSEAKPTLSKYLTQKLRHISTSPYYKPSVKFLLGLFSLTQIISNLLAFLLLFSSIWKIALATLIVKYITATLTYKKSAQLFHEGSIFLFTPLLDLLLTFYYVILTLSYPFKNKKTWS